MTVTRDQLIARLTEAGVYRFTWAYTLADVAYTPVDGDWLLNDAWPAWVADLPTELIEFYALAGVRRQRPRWLAEVWDCDNAIGDLQNYVIRCAASFAVQRGAARGGTAFGIWNYLVGGDPTKGHAAGWWLDAKTGAVRFLDQYNGVEVVPTQPERASAWFGSAR